VLIENHTVFIIGLTAGACGTFSYIPQIYHIVKRRSAYDISDIMFTGFSIQSFLWLVYGVEVHSLPVAIANGISLLLNLSILYLKWSLDRTKTSKIAISLKTV
jgi:MtN3 and saliva related transmembrane protein